MINFPARFCMHFILQALILTLLFTSCATSEDPSLAGAPESGEGTGTVVPEETPTSQGDSQENVVPTPTIEAATHVPVDRLDGDQILRDSISTVRQIENFQFEANSSGGLGSGTSECQIQLESFFCSNDVEMADGNQNSNVLIQHDGRSWFLNDAADNSWVFLREGFKIGYSGLNDYGLVADVTSATAGEFEGNEVYIITYHFEPEPLLNLITNNPDASSEFIPTATSVQIVGESLIDQETNLPVKERVQIEIESETKPLFASFELFFNWTGPVDIELPLGEDLLILTDQFFTNINEEAFPAAYALFSEEARAQLSLEEFEAFITSNNQLFTGYRGLILEAYESDLQFQATDSSAIRRLIIKAQYQNDESRHFAIIFGQYDDKWHLLRFDTISDLPSS